MSFAERPSPLEPTQKLMESQYYVCRSVRGDQCALECTDRHRRIHTCTHSSDSPSVGVLYPGRLLIPGGKVVWALKTGLPYSLKGGPAGEGG